MSISLFVTARFLQDSTDLRRRCEQLVEILQHEGAPHLSQYLCLIWSCKYLKASSTNLDNITCTKILVLWLVELHSLFWLFIPQGDKTSYCTTFGSARVQKLFTIALTILECSVFPIQSSDVCSKTRLIKKTMCETLRRANVTGVVRAFSVMQASV